jgi:hypothetical protein
VLIEKPGKQLNLITDPKEIKKEVNLHFQTVAGSTNRPKDIFGRWHHQYEPLNHINENIYHSIMNDIIDEEWTRHIHTLPNGKASGPSSISYEMIKHSSLEMKQQLLLLTNEIIKQGKLPNDYKLANIYPIPKPKPWVVN